MYFYIICSIMYGGGPTIVTGLGCISPLSDPVHTCVRAHAQIAYIN
jgi:hypothetical protein